MGSCARFPGGGELVKLSGQRGCRFGVRREQLEWPVAKAARWHRGDILVVGFEHGVKVRAAEPKALTPARRGRSARAARAGPPC